MASRSTTGSGAGGLEAMFAGLRLSGGVPRPNPRSNGHPRDRQECARRNRTSNKKVIKNKRPPKPPTWIDLPLAKIPEDLKELVSNSSADEVISKYPILLEKLTIANYVEKMTLVMNIDEIERQLDFRRYDMDNVSLKRMSTLKGVSFYMNVPGLADGRPSLMVGDTVTFDRPQSSEVYEGKICAVEKDGVQLVFDPRFDRQFYGQTYNVLFRESRGPVRKCHWALTMVSKLDPSVLFPLESINFKVPLLNTTTSTRRFINKNLNERQKSAVVNIIRGECRPSPYVLFGPPGTGKTLTLVEAILQIYTLFPKSRILVCGVSNTCADSMAIKIIESKLVDAKNVVRVIARSRLKHIPDELENYSTLADKIERWMDARIVVSTTSNVGAIAVVDKIKFTHTIIDEAAQSTEPDCLMAIIMSAMNGGVTVLAGDPYQLGPVIHPGVAADNGMSTTLMDRLCAMKPYKRHALEFATCGFYDPRCLTKLVESHRTCDELIKINSDLFYNSELISHPKMDVKLLMKMELDFPIQFIDVKGNDGQTINSPSWINTMEGAAVVVRFKDLLKVGVCSDDIGIITPYRGQAALLRKFMEQNSLPVCSGNN